MSTLQYECIMLQIQMLIKVNKTVKILIKNNEYLMHFLKYRHAFFISNFACITIKNKKFSEIKHI